MTDLAPQTDTRNGREHLVDGLSRLLQGVDQRYALMTRVFMRLVGAGFVVLGLLLVVGGRQKLALSPSDATSRYWPQGDMRAPFILGLMTAGLGGLCWLLASGRPWRLFDRLILSPFPHRDRESTNSWQVVLWWELRRLPYNGIVGAFGVLSGAVSFIAAGISESLGGEPVGMPDGIFIIAAPIRSALPKRLGLLRQVDRRTDDPMDPARARSPRPSAFTADSSSVWRSRSFRRSSRYSTSSR
jgi:hypothetical protein